MLYAMIHDEFIKFFDSLQVAKDVEIAAEVDQSVGADH